MLDLVGKNKILSILFLFYCIRSYFVASVVFRLMGHAICIRFYKYYLGFFPGKKNTKENCKSAKLIQYVLTDEFLEQFMEESKMPSGYVDSAVKNATIHNGQQTILPLVTLQN